jgi:hypothetical protein
MENFIKNFERQPDGAWLCVSSAEITTVMGRIQVTQGARFTPGTIFMAVDIVRLLEQEGERQRRIHEGLNDRRAGQLASAPRRP